MELFPNNYDDGIDVEFIRDIEVVHLIKDEPTQSKKTKKTFNNNSTDEDYSENESSVVLKPKALFEEGDVPGDRLFSFHSKQGTSTSQSNKLSQKIPTSNTKISNSIKITQQGKARQQKQNNTKDDNDSNIFAQDLFGNEIEIKSRTHRKSNRATSKSKEKNESSDNDSENLTDGKFIFDTPKKSKKNHVHSTKVQNGFECLPKSTPKTPRSGKKAEIEQILTKTPRIVRKRIAKGIAYQKCEQLNELNDSDYSISDKSDESDSDSSIHSDVQIAQPVLKNKNILLRRSTRKKEVPFMYKSEEYFLSKSAKSLKKSKTSDNTLKLLKNPVLEKIQVDQLSVNSNNIHDKKLKALYKETISNFPYWLCLLKEGFNLLLYGFGSKRQIIDEFRISMLENESVLVINGFFPGLTLKEILESITIDLLDLESCPGSVELAIQQIEETQKLKTAEHIYILLHNLDGVELQNYKTQHVLSRISSLNNVHLIASIDRVNAALMWDNTKLGDYNFIWMDCTNFSPYTVETSYIESLMVKNTGSVHAFSALSNVFKSLNSNSKQILLLLIKDRIENKNDKKYGGVPFSILYSWCRQRFLVSTDLALRSQLTEFVDHQLVKWKRDADVLYVPVDVDVLIKFYKQNEEDDE